MRNRSVALLAVMTIALTALSSACAPLAVDNGEAPAASLSMFNDIPLPEGFKINEKDSQVYDTHLGRVGILRISGRLSKSATLQCFRDKMALNGWNKDSEFDNSAQHLLVFSKTPRSAAISVTEGWIYTDVEINVSAKQYENKPDDQTPAPL